MQSSSGSAGLDVQGVPVTRLVADVGCELSWGCGQMPTHDFSTWLGPLPAWWSEGGHPSHLTAGFLELALFPVLLVRAVTEPARIREVGKWTVPCDGGAARSHRRGAPGVGGVVAAIVGNYG